MPADPPRPEPNAALTSRTAVVASLLLFGAIVITALLLQGCSDDEQARAFVEDTGAAWPILTDPDQVAWDAFGPVGPPTSHFIDGEGVVRRVHIGAVNDEQLAEHLAAIGLEARAARATSYQRSGAETTVSGTARTSSRASMAAMSVANTSSARAASSGSPRRPSERMIVWVMPVELYMVPSSLSIGGVMARG
jgi:hypothetical protein